MRLRTLAQIMGQIQPFFHQKSIFLSEPSETPFYFYVKQLKYAVLVNTEIFYDVRNW